MSETLGPGPMQSGVARPEVDRSRFAGPAVAIFAALAVLNLWAAYRDREARAVDGRNASMVQAAREGLTNLTTVDHRHVDQDVQRILDSSAGEFRDDFAKNAQSFIDAARKAESTSVGTIAEVGLESAGPDLGRVLVALTVMTSNRGLPEKRPRNWRTRVTVVRSDGEFKVAAVEFVP